MCIFQIMEIMDTTNRFPAGTVVSSSELIHEISALETHMSFVESRIEMSKIGYINSGLLKKSILLEHFNKPNLFHFKFTAGSLRRSTS